MWGFPLKCNITFEYYYFFYDFNETNKQNLRAKNYTYNKQYSKKKHYDSVFSFTFRMLTESVMTSRTQYTESAREMAIKAIRVIENHKVSSIEQQYIFFSLPPKKGKEKDSTEGDT